MINNINIILPLLEFKEEGDFLYLYPKIIIFVKKIYTNMDYEKIYTSIIEKAKLEKRVKTTNGTYYENHHIIPRSLGGTNEKNNLVLLTGKEHYICHHILTRLYPEHRGMAFSFWNMSNGLKEKRFKPSAKSIRRS